MREERRATTEFQASENPEVFANTTEDLTYEAIERARSIEASVPNEETFVRVGEVAHSAMWQQQTPERPLTLHEEIAHYSSLVPYLRELYQSDFERAA